MIKHCLFLMTSQRRGKMTHLVTVCTENLCMWSLQHAEPEHHPAQKLVLLSLLVYYASSICDVDSLEEEMEHLEKKGCSNEDIRQALKEVLNIELVVPVNMYLMVSVSCRLRLLVSK